MSRLSRSFVQKVLTSSALVLLLLATPTHLTAMERETPANTQTAAPGWFASLWSDLTAWLAGIAAPTPPPPPSSFVDGRCAVDPNGCPGG
jgi:hypothetical protein